MIDDDESPTKQKKVGFLKAKISNYMAKKYKGEKRRRHVQNILGIEQLLEDVSIEKKVKNMQLSNKFYILYGFNTS